MNQFEKDYYEYDGFWNDEGKSLKNNNEKIEITLSYLSNDITSVLDAACGNGIFTNILKNSRPELKIVGFDRSEQALKYVKAEKFLASIDSIPLDDNSFDCVIAHDVIEHLPVLTYEKALVELARIAKKYIIIGVPYKEKIKENVTQCPACFSIFSYEMHLRSFNDEKLKNLFNDCGFKNIRIDPCHKQTLYYGQNLYTKLFYPEIYYKFRSPICPICGYKNEELALRNNSDNLIDDRPAKKSSIVKSVLRSVWPKYSYDYEVVALYKKK